jgi:nitrite reductase/ring-hydroxylating ferredoxin subunit
MHYQTTKIKNFLILFLLGLTVNTCKKDTSQIFPDARVNIILNISNDLASLGVGSAMICPEQDQNGCKGIIIYRAQQYSFMAFDRLCTNYPNDTCAINIENGGAIGTCPCCGSKFILVDGSISQGPAFYPLIQYQTTVEGGRLYITN